MASYTGSAYIRGTTLYYTFTGSGNTSYTCCGIWVDKTAEQARTSTSGRIKSWNYKNYGSTFPNNGTINDSTTITRGSNHNIILCAGVGSYRGVYDSGHRAYTHTCNVNIYWRTLSFDSNGGSECSAIGAYPGESITLPTPSKVGYTFNGWYLGDTKWGDGGAVGTMPDSNNILTARWTQNYYYLDLNGVLDGSNSGNITNYGTADVYINGTRVNTKISDYCTSHPYGTRYEIKNIQALPGKTYIGSVYNNLSGTITGGVDARLKFVTNDMKVKVNNSWKVGTTYIKVNNTWKKATGVYIKVNGIWKKING